MLPIPPFSTPSHPLTLTPLSPVHGAPSTLRSQQRRKTSPTTACGDALCPSPSPFLSSPCLVNSLLSALPVSPPRGLLRVPPPSPLDDPHAYRTLFPPNHWQSPPPHRHMLLTLASFACCPTTPRLPTTPPQHRFQPPTHVLLPAPSHALNPNPLISKGSIPKPLTVRISRHLPCVGEALRLVCIEIVSIILLQKANATTTPQRS